MDRETVSEIVRHSLNEAFVALHGRGAGAGEWTKEIKTQLCVAGAAQQPPLYVCASGIEAADNWKWLYDVCWLRYGDANPLAEPSCRPWARLFGRGCSDPGVRVGGWRHGPGANKG